MSATTATHPPSGSCELSQTNTKDKPKTAKKETKAKANAKPKTPKKWPKKSAKKMPNAKVYWVIATNIQMEMEKEKARLDAKERKLDELIAMASNELREAHDHHKRYAFVTYRDIRGVKEFSHQTVIAIRAPIETKLEVPDLRESCRLRLKSERADIEVHLWPDNNGTVPESKEPEVSSVANHSEDMIFLPVNNSEE